MPNSQCFDLKDSERLRGCSCALLIRVIKFKLFLMQKDQKVCVKLSLNFSKEGLKFWKENFGLGFFAKKIWRGIMNKLFSLGKNLPVRRCRFLRDFPSRKEKKKNCGFFFIVKRSNVKKKKSFKNPRGLHSEEKR